MTSTTVVIHALWSTSAAIWHCIAWICAYLWALMSWCSTNFREWFTVRRSLYTAEHTYMYTMYLSQNVKGSDCLQANEINHHWVFWSKKCLEHFLFQSGGILLIKYMVFTHTFAYNYLLMPFNQQMNQQVR